MHRPLCISSRDSGRKQYSTFSFMLDMHEKILSSEHADTLAIMNKLASLYETYKQWREAEGQYARLAELKRKTLEETQRHWWLKLCTAG